MGVVWREEWMDGGCGVEGGIDGWWVEGGTEVVDGGREGGRDSINECLEGGEFEEERLRCVEGGECGVGGGREGVCGGMREVGREC